MHSHLDIKVNGKSLVIPEDSSLSVEEKNPLFNDVTFFSYPMQIPVEGNREVLKNIAHRDSNMRAMDLEHAAASIFADGLPLNHGQVITQDGSEIKDTFEFNIDAQQQSFSELIGDLECRDIRVKDDIFIGEQLGNIKISFDYTSRLSQYVEYETDDRVYYYAGSLIEEARKDKHVDETLNAPQALGFSIYGRTQGFPAAATGADGKIILTDNSINVDKPYPFPYCNAKVCYAHRGVKRNDDGTKETYGYVTGDGNGYLDVHDYGKYWVLPAERQQSGICFYVLYFLDCLFEQLGVVFNKDELMEIEDLKRLCFFTTLQKCDLVDTNRKLNNLSDINSWLSSRNCGGKISLATKYGEKRYDVSEGVEVSDYLGEFKKLLGGKIRYYMNIKISNVKVESSIYEMYANSDNFPDVSVSSVISSLENAFGIRFFYDPESKTVTARIAKNLFKSDSVFHFNGKVLSMIPVNSKTTGIRVRYSAEDDKSEQLNNIRDNIKDYDTNYNYIDYNEENTELRKTYTEIVQAVSATNRTVYVDVNTGNSYRVKVSSEGDTIQTLNPVLFQVGAFKGVEIGDCSDRNKDNIKDFTIDFSPISQSIVNAGAYSKDTTNYLSPVLATYLDVEMEHEYLKKEISSPVFIDDTHKDRRIYGISFAVPFNDYIDTSIYMSLEIAENYDPTQTDSGNSPLQDIDWGLSVALMRGGNGGVTITDFDMGYDGFGNSRWKNTIGIYTMDNDTMDVKGNIYSNGADHFSLKIRSWPSFVYYYDGNGKLHLNNDLALAGKRVEQGSQYTWLIPCVSDETEQGVIANRIRSRGLYDSFIFPLAHFWLNMKPYKVKVLATVAQLLDIRNHWSDKFIIDGKTGWINAIKYNIEKATGVSEAELEFYSL